MGLGYEFGDKKLLVGVDVLLLWYCWGGICYSLDVELVAVG